MSEKSALCSKASDLKSNDPSCLAFKPPFLYLHTGVGIATMVMVTYYNVYYCVIVAWSLYYFVASFVAIPNLPWDTCGKCFQVPLCIVVYLQTMSRIIALLESSIFALFVV